MHTEYTGRVPNQSVVRVLHILGPLRPSGMERMLVSAADDFRNEGVVAHVYGLTRGSTFTDELRQAGYEVMLGVPVGRSLSAARALRRIVADCLALLARMMVETPLRPTGLGPGLYVVVLTIGVIAAWESEPDGENLLCNGDRTENRSFSARVDRRSPDRMTARATGASTLLPHSQMGQLVELALDDGSLDLAASRFPGWHSDRQTTASRNSSARSCFDVISL